MKTEVYEKTIEILISKIEEDQMKIDCKDYRIKALEAQIKELEEKASVNAAKSKKIETRKEE